MAEEAPKKTRIYCNYCKQDTNHDLKGEHTVKSYDHESGYGEMLTDRLLICMGCEHGVLQQEYSNSEMMDDYGQGYSTVLYFPERSQHDLSPKPYTKLKPKLTALYG